MLTTAKNSCSQPPLYQHVIRFVSMDGAADFKVGIQNRIRERSKRKKFLVPSLFQMWGTISKQILVGAY